MVKENNLKNIFLMLISIFLLWLLIKKNNSKKIEYFAPGNPQSNMVEIVKSFKDKPLEEGEYFAQFFFKDNNLAKAFFLSFNEANLFFNVKNNGDIRDKKQQKTYVLNKQNNRNYTINKDYSLDLLSQGIYEYNGPFGSSFALEFKKNLNVKYFKNHKKKYKLYNLDEVDIYWLPKGIQYLKNILGTDNLGINEGDKLTNDHITEFISNSMIVNFLKLYNPKYYVPDNKKYFFIAFLLNNLFATIIDPFFTKEGIDLIEAIVRVSNRQDEFDNLPLQIKPVVNKSLELIHLQFLLKNYLRNLLMIAGEQNREDEYRIEFALINTYEFADYSIFLDVVKLLMEKNLLEDRLKTSYSLTSDNSKIIIKDDGRPNEKFEFNYPANISNNIIQNNSNEEFICENNYITVREANKVYHFFISE